MTRGAPTRIQTVHVIVQRVAIVGERDWTAGTTLIAAIPGTGSVRMTDLPVDTIAPISILHQPRLLMLEVPARARRCVCEFGCPASFPDTG